MALATACQGVKEGRLIDWGLWFKESLARKDGGSHRMNMYATMPRAASPSMRIFLECAFHLSSGALIINAYFTIFTIIPILLFSQTTAHFVNQITYRINQPP